MRLLVRQTPLIVGLWLPLFACDPLGGLPALDRDHDGWIEPYDCDDRDPLRSPDAAEVCNGSDDDCDGQVDEEDALDARLYYADTDGDGWGDEASAVRGCQRPVGAVEVGGDCNDVDSTVSPEADERCDDQDNDCDGLVDEADATDALRWYRDADEDGYGDPTVWEDSCTAVAGTSDNDLDCDDRDASVNPAAAEVCDPVAQDDDCNGLADDADPGLVDAPHWYLDQDGDGYGQDGDALRSCLSLAGRVEVGGDCADLDPGVNPGVVELCADGLDNDCDGLSDAEDPDNDGDRVVYVDGDGDGFGDPARPIGPTCTLLAGQSADPTDCDDGDSAVNPAAAETWYDGVDGDCDGSDDDDADEDGFRALAAGGDDCQDEDGSVYPGALERCADGVDQDCDGATDPCAPWVWEGEESSGAGDSLAWGADLDGDGLPDLVVGAPRGGEVNEGQVLLVGGPAGEGDRRVITGGEDGRYLGAAVALAADWLALGGPGAASGDGGVHLLDSPIDDGVVTDLACAFFGGEGGEEAGSALALLGDLDGDGVDDLAIGAPLDSGEEVRRGRVALVPARCGDDLSLDEAPGLLWGEAAGDQAGEVLAAAGDTDGDGLPELLVGAPSARGPDLYSGSAWLVAAPLAGDLSLADAAAVVRGSASGDQLGAALAAAGDVDGDGYDDVLVGAPGEGSGVDRPGAAYLLTGPWSGELSLDRAFWVVRGEGDEDQAGSALGGGFDLDGDGRVDLAVGAPGAGTAFSGGGSVTIFLAPEAGTCSVSEGNAVVEGDAVDLGVGRRIGAVTVEADPVDLFWIGLPGSSVTWRVGPME